MFIPWPEEAITGTFTPNPVVGILTENFIGFLSSYRESQHSCLKHVRKKKQAKYGEKKRPIRSAELQFHIL
jgi:hypothetical protein